MWLLSRAPVLVQPRRSAASVDPPPSTYAATPQCLRLPRLIDGSRFQPHSTASSPPRAILKHLFPLLTHPCFAVPAVGGSFVARLQLRFSEDSGAVGRALRRASFFPLPDPLAPAASLQCLGLPRWNDGSQSQPHSTASSPPRAILKHLFPLLTRVLHPCFAVPAVGGSFGARLQLRCSEDPSAAGCSACQIPGSGTR